MDSFLQGAQVALTFQPFARQRDFENQIRQMRPAFVLLPYWYYEIYHNELQLELLLSPVQNGTLTYTKVLLVRREAALSVEALKEKKLAMTAMGPVGTEFLSDLLQTDLGQLKINVITTSKDSDSLFALALGQVDAAVVSRQNLEQFGFINPGSQSSGADVASCAMFEKLTSVAPPATTAPP